MADLFNGVLLDGDRFQAVIKALKTTIPEIVLHFKDGRLYWRATNEFQTILMNVQFRRGAFRQYELRDRLDECSIALNLTHLHTVLKAMRIQSGDQLMMRISAAADALHMQVSKGGRCSNGSVRALITQSVTSESALSQTRYEDGWQYANVMRVEEKSLSTMLKCIRTGRDADTAVVLNVVNTGSDEYCLSAHAPRDEELDNVFFQERVVMVDGLASNEYKMQYSMDAIKAFMATKSVRSEFEVYVQGWMSVYNLNLTK